MADAREGARTYHLSDGSAHAGPVYTEGHPSLKGRLIFTNSEPGVPEAAFIEENDGTKEEIDDLVKQGYLVRTRTDEGTEQARTNDTNPP